MFQAFQTVISLLNCLIFELLILRFFSNLNPMKNGFCIVNIFCFEGEECYDGEFVFEFDTPSSLCNILHNLFLLAKLFWTQTKYIKSFEELAKNIIFKDQKC